MSIIDILISHELNKILCTKPNYIHSRLIRQRVVIFLHKQTIQCHFQAGKADTLITTHKLHDKNLKSNKNFLLLKAPQVSGILNIKFSYQL